MSAAYTRRAGRAKLTDFGIARVASGGQLTAGELLADAIADARSGVVEVSPMVRAFLRDRATVSTEVATYFAAMLYLSTLAQVGLGKTAGPLAFVALLSVRRLVLGARRLLRAGYRFDDVRAAILSEMTARKLAGADQAAWSASR